MIRHIYALADVYSMKRTPWHAAHCTGAGGGKSQVWHVVYFGMRVGTLNFALVLSSYTHGTYARALVEA